MHESSFGRIVFACAVLSLLRPVGLSPQPAPAADAPANPDAAHRFVTAMSETAAWANAHHAETGALLAARLKLTPQVLAAMSRTRYAEALTAASIDPPLAVAVKYGILKPITAAELLAASAF